PKEWAVKAKAVLESKDFGAPWASLVEQWWAKEKGSGFVAPTKSHSARLRPAQVHQWVKTARKTTPAILSVEAFAKEWSAWWIDINPAWRKTQLPMAKADGPWGYLDFPGQNGFLNVIICLKWWREKLDVESQEWKEAVEDVTWVLSRMNGCVVCFISIVLLLMFYC
ncbi:hypothetical protein B0H11DRAFT_1756501, partial [Mycena galericulata]